jgi:DNA-binding NarL/FixJ family response regulator
MRVIDDLADPRDTQEDSCVKVLVLEDDSVAAAKLTALLEQASMIPLCASSLIEARALLDEHEFDAAVIDVNLPDGSGLALVPLLQAAELATACVVLTSTNDHGIVRRAVELGVTQFLRKPASVQQIRQALGMALHRSRMIRAWLDKPAAESQNANPTITGAGEEVGS